MTSTLRAGVIGAGVFGGYHADKYAELPGVSLAAVLDTPEPPRLLEAVRYGPPSPRNLDVSVVIDLMIHDLDLALALSAAEPMAVEAEGAATINDLLDHAEAEVNFDDGFTGLFRSS